jgi:tetratricopeptide (TPR) repeat protein
MLDDLREESVPEDISLEDLPSSTPDGMREQARRLAEAARTPGPPSRRRLPRLWLVAAAAVVVVVSGTMLLMRPAADQVSGLLARDYGEHRTSELRFPGAPYGPIRQERGGNAGRSQSLLEAEVEISQELSRHPADSRWLQLSGRVKLLGWRYDEAIANLSQAKTLAPEDPSIWADLAAAYFERAQVRDDQGDYHRALDLLSGAIERNPSASELRFNRAIILTHLNLMSRAIEEWNEFLRLDPTGAWADEARVRLAEVKNKAP